MSSLALKYRPANFNDLVGQLHASRSLKNAIEHGQIGHAYLFFGSRGVGKTSTARILAKSLNCQTNGTGINPCGTCENCKDISSGNCIDVIEMDAASNRGIDHIRDLRESARFSPMRSRYKIYIIDEVHMLTTESFNALLKILEEPPEHVIFIMATTEQHKIPETILSRCQSFAFRKFSHEDLESRLRYILTQENIAFDEKSLFPIIQRAEGSMRDALSLTDQVIAYCGGEKISMEDVELVLGVTPIKIYLDFLAAVQERDARKTLLQIDQLHSQGTNLKQFLWDFLAFVKNALLIKAQISDNKSVLMTEQDFSQLQEILRSWSEPELTAVFEHFYKLYSNWSMFQTSKSSEIRVTLEVSIIHLFHLLNQPTISGLVQKIADLKNAIQQGKPFEDTQAKKFAKENQTSQKTTEKQEPAATSDVSSLTPQADNANPQNIGVEKEAEKKLEKEVTKTEDAPALSFTAPVKEENVQAQTKEPPQQTSPADVAPNFQNKTNDENEKNEEQDIDALIKKEFLASEENPPAGLFGE